MNGAARFALRLFRRHAARMLFLSVCVALGVAFLAAVANLLGAFRGAIASKARELLAADLAVSSNRPFSDAAGAEFAALEARGARAVDVLEFASMLQPARAAADAFLVSVKAIGPGYPLYGRFETRPAHAAARLVPGQALIEDSIALQHGVEVGARVRLGAAELTVAGILLAEPDRAVTAFNLAPRVVIARATALDSGLLRFGSRINHRKLFALPDAADPRAAAIAAARRLEDALDDPYLRVQAFAESQPALRRGLENVSLYFVLVALVALLLGAVGMGAGMTAFLNEQLETAAVLRCLGCAPRDVARVYGALCLLVGLGGGVLGALGGWALSAAGVAFLTEFLGLTLEPVAALRPGTVLEAVLVATVSAAAAGWLQIAALARTAPLDVLRERRAGLSVPWTGWAGLIALGLGALFGYAAWKAHSPEVAWKLTLALGAAGGAAAALIGAALRLAEGLVRPIGSSRLFAVRHGLLQLVRRRSRTVVFLFSLSFGFALLGALEVVRAGLDDRLRLTQGLDIPDLFLVDIQRDQKDGVVALMNEYARTAPKLAPLVRARLTRIDGRPVLRRKYSELTLEERRKHWFLVREQNLTFKDELQASERVIRGAFWKPGETRPQVSIERRVAEDTGIGLGDVLTLDIQGRPLEAEVTSLRAIEWESARPNFFLVLPTKVLERAPHYYVGSFGVRDPAKSARFQREVVRRYPNVSVIDIGKVLDRVEGVLAVLLDALAALAWFCVGVGLVVLAGMVALGHRERRDQTALLRSLGLDKAAIVRIDAVEFLGIGLFALGIAAAVAAGLGWALARQFDIPFAPDWGAFAAVLVPAAVLPLVVGLAANWRVYGAGVLDNLRRET